MSVIVYTNPFFSVDGSSVSDVNFVSEYPDNILFKSIRNSSFSHCSFLTDEVSVSVVIDNVSFSNCVFRTSQIANVITESIFENSSFVLSGCSIFAGVCQNSLFNLTAIDVNYTESRLFKQLTNVTFDCGVISNSVPQDYDEDETEMRLVLADAGTNVSLTYVFYDETLDVSKIDSESITQQYVTNNIGQFNVAIILGHVADKFKRVLQDFQIFVDPFPANDTRCVTFGHAMLCHLQCQTNDIAF